MNLSLRLGVGNFKIDGVLVPLDSASSNPNGPIPGGTINFTSRPSAQRKMLSNNNENLHTDKPYANRTQAIIYSDATY